MNDITITCAIIDDEPLAISMIEKFVERTPFLELKGAYSDSLEAIEALRKEAVNLVFLDIQMPDLDGMEFAKMLPSETRIIFTTAFKEYAFDSYEVYALDFLLKPVRYQKFMVAVEKAKEWFARSTPVPTTIFLRTDGELRQYELSHLLYVEGMKDYMRFHFDDGTPTVTTHLTMHAVEDMLPSQDFIRVHRSYIVAIKKIRSIDRNDCITIGKEIIHVTETYKEKLKEIVKF